MIKNTTKLIFAFLCIIALLVVNKTYAYKNPGTPTGFINDYTNTLTSEQKQSLEKKISDFEKQTTNEISVVIIKNLDGDTIENFAEKLFKDWGIGKKEKDNGVLVLISIEDKKIRIETGYGIEPYIVDTQAFWLIDKIMKPEFQNGNYYTGIDKAVDKIISATQGEELPSQNQNTESKNGDKIIFFVILASMFILNISAKILGKTKSFWLGGIIGAILGAIVGIIINIFFVGVVMTIFFALLGLLFDYSASKNGGKNHRGPWFWGGFGGGGKSGGGGFGGFGGGSSGGGGASGGW